MPLHRCFTLTVVCLLALSGAAQSRNADDKDELTTKDLAALKGTWELVSAERRGGEAFPDAFVESFKFIIDGNKLTIVMPNNNQLKSTFTIDPTKKLKEMDITTEIGGNKVVSPGIYSLEKDTLKVVLDEKDKVRAKGFVTEKDSSHMSFVFKRKKD
jgi:uncharacterized protein (TIGR03067 family)